MNLFFNASIEVDEQKQVSHLYLQHTPDNSWCEQMAKMATQIMQDQENYPATHETISCDESEPIKTVHFFNVSVEVDEKNQVTHMYLRFTFNNSWYIQMNEMAIEIMQEKENCPATIESVSYDESGLIKIVHLYF